MAWIAIPLAGACPPSAAAQALNPTDESLLQQERQQDLRERLEADPDVRLQRETRPAPRLPAQETPCVDIDVIRLPAGARPVFAHTLERALANVDWHRGRCLGTRGIGVIVREVQQQLIDAGLITSRASAPPQDLGDGQLTLSILPGRVGAIRPRATSGERARPKPAFPIRDGELLNLRDIEQGLENLERLDSVTADIAIEPGK